MKIDPNIDGIYVFVRKYFFQKTFCKCKNQKRGYICKDLHKIIAPIMMILLERRCAIGSEPQIAII